MRQVVVTTSWDDGHKLDMRLAGLLERYAIPATFYVSPNDHEFKKEDLLTNEQIQTLAAHFEIGAHTMTHPRLTEVSDGRARQEMTDSKVYLEKLVKKTITSFCYPGGNYAKRHVTMAREAGFTYARTVKRHFYNLKGALQESHTTVNAYNHYQDLWKIFKFAGYNPFKVPYYFQWQNLAKAMFDKVQREGGVFHLWGHSWEIDAHNDWEKLEEVLAHISAHDDVRYATNGELPALVKPRLLIATPFYPPFVGGVEHYAYEMAHGAAMQNYEVSVITAHDTKYSCEIQKDGVRVYRLPTQFKVMNTPIHLLWYWYVRKIIRREDPEVVNVHAPVPFLPDITMAAARGRRRIVTYHAGTMHKGRWFIDIFIRLYESLILSFMLRGADYIICSSDFVRNGFLRRYQHKSYTITPGVATDVFAKRSNAPHTRRVLFVGNFRNGIKGLEYLRQAMAKVPNAQLHVIGDGRQIADDYTIYHGTLRGQDLVEQYHLADVLVLPSIGKTESFGMVLIEAMACGVPVIGSDVGGIPTVIEDGADGLIVPPANSTALAKTIRDVLDNSTMADRLAEQAYNKVLRQFTWQTEVEKYLEKVAVVRQHRPAVVHVAGYYPPHLGGMENVAQSVAEGLAERDWAVRVVTSNFPHSNVPMRFSNLEVRRYKGFEFAHTPVTPGSIWALLCIPGHSVVHLHLAQAFYPEWVWFICKLRRIPYLVHFHLDLQPSGRLGKLFLVYKAVVLHKVIRGAQKVVVFSSEQQAFITRTYGLSPSKIAVIPNGVGLDFFAEPHAYGIGGQRQLLFVGRLASQKRVDRLIGAMAELKTDAHLTIIGDGEDRAKLEHYAHLLRVANITFVGRKDPEEIRTYYARADVLVMPSDREGMSLVTLEAMAAGLPIVASNTEGLADLLQDVGVLVDNPSPRTFALALDELLNDPQKLSTLSVLSAETAKSYAWPHVIDAFENVYREIAK